MKTILTLATLKFFLLLIIIMASISWGLTWIFRIIGSVSPPVKSWHFLRLIHSGAAMDMSYFFLIFHDSNLSPASIILENIWAWSERKYFSNFASEAANVSVVHLTAAAPNTEQILKVKAEVQLPAESNKTFITETGTAKLCVSSTKFRYFTNKQKQRNKVTVSPGDTTLVQNVVLSSFHLEPATIKIW